MKLVVLEVLGTVGVVVVLVVVLRRLVLVVLRGCSEYSEAVSLMLMLS